MLNELLKNWPNGVVLTSKWLSAHGYYKQLVKQYADAGWVKKVGHGAYVKLGDSVNWVGAVFALQTQLNLSIHIGGITALELYGLAQNITFNQDSHFFLFNTTEQKKPLPKWFVKFFPNCVYVQNHLFNKAGNLETKEIDNIKINIASPEMAILELLSQVPNAFDFSDANNIVENLQLLRPNVLQSLLQECLSIKVKRLFLYLANKHRLPCMEQLDVKLIELGKGKRVIGQGGHYISEYLISVPKLEQEDTTGIGDV